MLLYFPEVRSTTSHSSHVTRAVRSKYHYVHKYFVYSYLPPTTSHCYRWKWVVKSSTQFVNVHYCDVIMDAIASQITSLTIVYSIVYSDADQRKHQSSASLAFVRGIHRGPVNSPHKWPATRKMVQFDDVIMSVIFSLSGANLLWTKLDRFH